MLAFLPGMAAGSGFPVLVTESESLSGYQNVTLPSEPVFLNTSGSIQATFPPQQKNQERLRSAP